MAVVFPNLEEIICEGSELTELIEYPDPYDTHAYRYPENPDPILFYYLETISIVNSRTGSKSLDLHDWLRRRSELGYPISTVKWPVEWPLPNPDTLDAIRQYSKLVIWDAEEDLWSRQCRDCTHLPNSFKLS